MLKTETDLCTHFLVLVLVENNNETVLVLYFDLFHSFIEKADLKLQNKMFQKSVKGTVSDPHVNIYNHTDFDSTHKSPPNEFI